MSSANLHLPQSDCAISLCEQDIASLMSRTSLLVKTVGNRAGVLHTPRRLNCFCQPKRGSPALLLRQPRMSARDLRRALPWLSGALCPTNQSPRHSATPGSADDRRRSGRLSLTGTGDADQSRHAPTTDMAFVGSRAIDAAPRRSLQIHPAQYRTWLQSQRRYALGRHATPSGHWSRRRRRSTRISKRR